jgi:hypothetical protein
MKQDKLQSLPTLVPPTYYRFFCKFLRRSLFDRSTVLDIEDCEVTLLPNQFILGLVDGALCVDIKELTVKKLGLA